MDPTNSVFDERSNTMARELSELLGELSNQARKVEDTFAAVAEETDAKAAERRDQTRTAAKTAVDTMDASIAAVEESVEGNWRVLTDRIGAEIGDIQASIAERRHARDVEHAEEQAAAAAARAERAIAFAKAAIETAGLAVMDAAVARREAAALKRG
jgi:hypothetical protein